MSPRSTALPLILAGLLVATGAAAQTYSTIPQPQSDADALGAAMRTLATNPQNVDALITAGELSLRLGDASGAAALFARADKVDPRNGRVKAGMASILVHEERPGEALRYFGMAEGYGLAPARFAAERGLAYDLIGEQDRAQRDYRLALASGTNDEVVRRYGLSLGIAGKQEAALQQLDTLIRKGDRGAWRARAFVLAMNGDVAGANKIATTMMPPGMAQGLGPFFQRLPALSAADRAFAVHYGETRPTPERLADAKLTPALAPLAPEPGAATMLAAARPVAAPTPAVDDRKTRRDRQRGRDRTELAAVAPAATPAPKTNTPPSPPVYAAATVQPLPGYPSASTGAARAVYPAAAAMIAPAATTSTQRPITTPPVVTRTPTHVAQPAAAPPAGNGTPASAPQLTQASPPPATPTPQGGASTPSTPLNRPMATAGTTAAVVGPAQPVRSSLVPTGNVGVATSTLAPVGNRSMAVPTAGTTPPATAAVRSTQLAAVQLPSITATPTATPMTAPVRATPAPLKAVTSTAPARYGGGSALAEIMAGIAVPPSELAVAPATAPLVPRATRNAVARAAATPTATPVTGTRALPLARKTAPAAVDEAPATTTTDRRKGKQLAATDAAKPDRKGKAGDPDAAADERKAAKLTPAQKRAADKKALADKTAADERKAARSEPERIWVQVAGGANEDDLGKAWRAQQSRTAALKGRAAYSTPLRATNRVVTGPFKTDAEARAFVNQLAKQGVSAFPFISEKGQKMTKLPSN